MRKAKSLRSLKIARGVTHLAAQDVRHLMKSPGGRARSKYGARSVEHDGHFFASTAEKDHYLRLKLLQRAGEITDLELQPRFPILINNIHVCEYRADFRYRDKAGAAHVVDVKGVRTAAYKIKRALMRAVHGIDVEEV